MTRIFGRDPQGQAPPEYGSRAPAIRTRQFVLTNARDLVEIEIGGNALWAVQASDNQANIDVRLGDPYADPIPFRRGLSIEGIPFSRFFVSHDAQAGATITLLAVAAPSVDFINPARYGAEVEITKATVVDTAADVTLAATATTQILAANADRRSAYITNLATNTQTMRIGDANAAAARGTPLAPGETILIETTEAIYGYNPGGAGEDVAISWTED